MEIEVSRNGVGQEQDRIADFEARLQSLENRMVQMQAEMREEMASLYRAGTLHGKIITKLSAAARVSQQLVERLYHMVQQKGKTTQSE